MIKIDDLEMMGIDEIVETLHVSPQAARQMCRDGELQAKKVKRKWYVSKDELKRYLTTDTTQPQEQPA